MVLDGQHGLLVVDGVSGKGDHGAGDDARLERAVALSDEHARAGHGGPFGAVVVGADGAVLAEGWNEVASTNDPTAHAEIVAIRRACAAAGSSALAGATLYASCEPCPMCLAAAYWARIGRVVPANTHLEAAAIGFDDRFIYEEIAREPAERRIPMHHAPRESARAVFARWHARGERVRE